MSITKLNFPACAWLSFAVAQWAAAQTTGLLSNSERVLKKAEAGQDKLSAKADLTPVSFRALHTLLRPHENEWRHLKVDWLTDVVAARKKAVAEDKPIVICYTGGAGYNEPLGVC
jgi:hypothetical protein